MLCEVDEKGLVIKITGTKIFSKASERVVYPWTKEGEVYTTEPPLEYLKSQKLLEVDAWTASKITGGFVSECSGERVRYDSDKDTQLTMQGIALNVDTPLFAEKYPQGCPVRGYLDVYEGVATVGEKTVFWLTAEQVLRWMADLSMHIGNCKQAGWQKQAEVNACQSVAELDNIILN